MRADTEATAGDQNLVPGKRLCSTYFVLTANVTEVNASRRANHTSENVEE